MRIKMKKRTGRKEKIYKKYSLLWISVIALVVLDISVVSVSAYFSDREEKRNRITVGDSNIEIVEEFDPPEKIEPGSHFTKKVCMKNLGKSDCFIRCRLELSSEEILPYLEFDIDKAKWSLKEDGYYYYREAVEVKKQTTNLLEEIQKQLKKRQWGEVIRLEVEEKVDKRLLKILKRELSVSSEDIYEISGPLDLTFLMKMYGMSGFDHLKEPSYTPQPVPAFMNEDDIFTNIPKRVIFSCIIHTRPLTRW